MKDQSYEHSLILRTYRVHSLVHNTKITLVVEDNIITGSGNYVCVYVHIHKHMDIYSHIIGYYMYTKYMCIYLRIFDTK